MMRIHQQSNFRNQARVLPIAIGFATLFFGFLAMAAHGSYDWGNPLTFIGGVFIGVILTFVLHGFLWAKSFHPLDAIPSQHVISLSLFVCGFSGYLAYLWVQLIFIVLSLLPNIDLTPIDLRLFGWIGAVLGAVIFILAGLRMPRYAYLKFLVGFHVLGLGAVMLLVFVRLLPFTDWAAEVAARKLAELGADASLVWMLFVAWAAPLMLYLWKFRKYREHVRVVEIDPDRL